MSRRKIQPGLLSPADAADLSARLEWLEQRAIVAATGGILLTEGPGGTAVRQTPVTPYTPPPYSGCRLWHTSAYSVANNTMTDYAFNSDYNWTDRYWSSGSPAVITIPRAGMFLLTADVVWEANANGDRWVEVYDVLNSVFLVGAGSKPNTINGVTGTGFSLAVVFNATTANTYKLRVYQNSGGSISVMPGGSAGSTNTSLQITRLGDFITAFS